MEHTPGLERAHTTSRVADNRLAGWLNSLPEAQAVLAAEFRGRPVNKQNISEWRQGGYREWRLRAELVEQACQLSDAASDIADSAGDYLVDDLATVVSARYAQLLADWDGQPGVDFQQRVRVLRLLCPDVLQLQKGQQKATRLQLELEQHEKQEMEQRIQQAKQRATAPIWAALWLNTFAESFGGGEAGEQAAAHILEVQNGRAPGTLSHGDKSGTVKPSQTGSNQIKPLDEPKLHPDPTVSDWVEYMEPHGSISISLEHILGSSV